MADVVKSRRKALAFLEGCDPLLRSGGQMNHELRDEIRARLSQAGAGGVVVRPLEWAQDSFGGDEYRTTAKAGLFDDRYEIEPPYESMKSSFRVRRSRDIQPFAWEPSLDQAKAAAQADYEARILAVLAPSPSAGEPWAWARRWAFDEVDVMAIKKADRPPGWQYHDVTRRKIIADDVPLYATPPATPVQQTASVEAVDLHDFVTHRRAWRQALEMALAASDSEQVDGYWEHEIKAFDRAFDLIAPLASHTPAPMQGETGDV